MPTVYALPPITGRTVPVRLSRHRFAKDVIRVGTFYARNPETDEPMRLDVDARRMDQWVAAFGRMREAGVKCDLTIDHSDRAEDKKGEVTKLFREGDVLFAHADVACDDDAELVEKCPEVSIEVEPEFRDGEGRAYGEALTAVSIVRKPVVPGQQPFRRIAASRGSENGTVLVFSTNPPSDDPTPDKGPTMFELKLSDDQVKLAREVTGLGEDAKPEDYATKLVELAKTGKGASGLQTQITSLTTERDTLKGQVESLQKGKAPEVDQDTLEEVAEARKSELEALVTAGKITPAVGEKLAASLIGEAGKRKVICLSRKAATHAGYAEPLAKAVIQALKENDPVKLGQQSKGQRVSLSRATPSDSGDSDKPSEWVTEELKAANGSK